ncbi:MAG: DUF956 family protein [Streptococcaceae bacterium]|jgi:hypothetical protein|nr:DUF956 family protein [Streptococcaceae bacterium]
MVQSINTTSELTTKGTSFLGLGEYGKIMIGDKGYEFFNDRNINDYIQIPWEEVDYVEVSIMFKGKWIPRFAIVTKRNGRFSFSAKDPKQVLRAIREHIPADKILKAQTFLGVFKRAALHFFKKG